MVSLVLATLVVATVLIFNNNNFVADGAPFPEASPAAAEVAADKNEANRAAPDAVAAAVGEAKAAVAAAAVAAAAGEVAVEKAAAAGKAAATGEAADRGNAFCVGC